MSCFSKRAKNLVALAKLPEKESLPTFPFQSMLSPNVNSPSTSSTASSPVLGSPASPWWDNVFEAADILKINQQSCVKRKLFLSPEKGIEESVISNGNTVSPLASSGSLLSPLISIGRDINENSAEDMIVEDKIFQLPATSCRSSESEDALEGVDQCLLPNLLSTNLEDSQASHITSLSSADFGKHIDVSVLKSISTNVNKTKYPSHLKIYTAKLALNSGMEHTTPSGIVRQGRHVRAQCQEKCKRCSHPRLSQEERDQINKGFWELKKHEEQWKFISKSVIVSAPKRKFVSKGSRGEKLNCRIYFFSINGKERRVCKTTFKNTLCICDSWIDSAINHSSESGLHGDQRGKHKNRPKRGQKVVIRAVIDQTL